ncbi:MAG TPA: Rieske 2Fe-2S domain-containing protein [Candidatus Lustribacter sp.]|nr:Rieske 2Fe-2S domain-containing protein [Candidatus Lustribacter sp.]
MNEHTTTGSTLDLAHGDHHGTGGLPDRFADPGLPPHVARQADLNEKAAKRAERQVASLFAMSIAGTLLFLVAFFTIDDATASFVPFMGKVNVYNIVIGLGMALSLFGIGAGAVHWAKTLMPDHEIAEERHPLRSSDESRQDAVDTTLGGGEAAQLGRRPLIKATLGGALGLFALPFVVQVVRSLGPATSKDELFHTIWDIPTEGPAAGKPIRLMRDPLMTPIKAEEVTIGSVFHVMPETLQKYLDEGHHVLEEKGKAAVLLMRLDPPDITSQKAKDWGYQGIVAYSKICTHVGCPVGLYEQQTHHLLCPCHQSTFDVTKDCEVIFGPAKRPLAQLKITVDAEGYLVATQGFREAVGPSFWER